MKPKKMTESDLFEWTMRCGLDPSEIVDFYSDYFSTLYRRVPKKKKRDIFFALIDIRHEGGHKIFRDQWGQQNLDDMIDFHKRTEHPIFLPVLADIDCAKAWTGDSPAGRLIVENHKKPEFKIYVPLLIQLWPKGQALDYIRPPQN